MSAKLVLRVEWNETVRTRRVPFDTKKFSNFNPEILVEWKAPQVEELTRLGRKAFAIGLGEEKGEKTFDRVGFDIYCVSLKDFHQSVIEPL